MSGTLFNKYGAILDEDIAVLEACLTELAPNGVVRVCEIGMHDGATAKGIEAFLATKGARLEYWGIDPDPGVERPRYVPRNGAVVTGDSAEVFHHVPNDFDLLWIDGCHCFNHVVLDTLHYVPKVRNFGFVCFHDVNPKIQGHQHQYHGPAIPEFGVDVNHALSAIGFPWGPWEFFAEGIPDNSDGCGTRVYRKGRK